jgi:SAM-dependent methyltransferase
MADGYNAWAPSYDRDMEAMGYALPEIFIDVVSRHLPASGSRILDAGTGTGILGQRLAQRGYRHLVGIDMAGGMLDMAQRKDAYRYLRWMTLDQPLEFADHAFNGVVAMGVFNWSQAPLPALEEFVRVTRPGGRVVFSASVDHRGRCCCRAARRRIARAGRWRRLEAGPAFASHPGVAPHAQVRIFACHTVTRRHSRFPPRPRLQDGLTPILVHGAPSPADATLNPNRNETHAQPIQSPRPQPPPRHRRDQTSA